MLVAFKLNAGHTTTGNPRRGWIVADATTGNLVGFVDEGYRGRDALRLRYPDAVEIEGEVATTGAEYRALKKLDK